MNYHITQATYLPAPFVPSLESLRHQNAIANLAREYRLSQRVHQIRLDRFAASGRFLSPVRGASCSPF